jgi:hypothetical protein
MENLSSRFYSDPWMRRISVVSLSATLSACIGGIIYLPIAGHSTPQALAGIAVETVGILGAIAASSPTRHIDRSKK